ncbi:MAG: adenylate/guanylate cyclase domain-containing protein [Planctomycetota bacterium]|nr:adenylate/guanylate cyclase domain-containing protein [Planctomycetota bacterium]
MAPEQPAQSRLSFRLALMLGVVVVLLATVGLVGIVSFFNARFIVKDLSGTALEQTTERVHDQIVGLLDRAAHTGAVMARKWSERELGADQVHTALGSLLDAIQLNEDLSYLSMSVEAGIYGHIYRRSDGGVEARTHHPKDGGGSIRRDYEIRGGWIDTEPKNEADDTYDHRERPWYKAAKAAGTQTWPAVYLFKNPPNPDYPGLTCATPILRTDGSFHGVITADFDLIALGEFLGELGVLEGGTAFVVEIDADGARRVIAHPDPRVFLGAVEQDGETKEVILPLEAIKSEAIRALLSQVPDEPDLGTLHNVEFDAGGQPFVGAWMGLRSRHDVRWLLGIHVPRDGLMREVEQGNLQTLIIGLASLLLALGLVFFLARRIAEPLESLARETESIAKFELQPSDAEAPPFTELARLSTAIEEMKTGLRSFQRYVPSELVRRVLASGQEARLGGERRELSVCFTDIADFTAMAERMTPEALVDVLGAYFEVVAGAFQASGGTVDKFIGDAVMAFWGAPARDPAHAVKACRGALAAAAGVASLREELAAEGGPDLRVRLGIATGELVVGNIGSASRINYTVVGDPVNLASRLEGLNKMYGTSILVDEQTYAAAREVVIARPVERVSVKGRREGTRVYELLALRETASADVPMRAARYEEALDLYEAGRFKDARRAYERLLQEDPLDGVALVLIQRCRELERDPPGPDWDGIRRMETK